MAAVAKTLLSETPSAQIVQLKLDVSDLDSVKAFGRSLEEADCGPLDVVLLNAGAIITDWSVSKQGFESTFATNHLGHWLLVGLIFRHIKPASTSRIIAVSSLAHKMAKSINYDQAQGERGRSYDFWNAYSQSKLAGQLFVTELNRRLQTANSPIIVASAHPGLSDSDLGRHLKWFSAFGIMKIIGPLISQSTRQGALPLIYACSDEDITRSSYYGPHNLGGTRGLPISNSPKSDLAVDEAMAAELWTHSEKMCDFSYDAL